MVYDDLDDEDMPVSDVKRIAIECDKTAADATLASETCTRWQSITVERALPLLMSLQARGGTGPGALAKLRAHYAATRAQLDEDKGWLVMHDVLVTDEPVPLTQFLYYGGLNDDGTPTDALPPGETRSVRALYEAEVAPTRMLSSLAQVHLFRGAKLVLGALGSGQRLPAEEEMAVKAAMTPRRVMRDGSDCPGEAVGTPAAGEEPWLWSYTTRMGGKTAKTRDVLYISPCKSGSMRSLPAVKRFLEMTGPVRLWRRACKLRATPTHTSLRWRAVLQQAAKSLPASKPQRAPKRAAAAPPPPRRDSASKRARGAPASYAESDDE